MLSPKGFGPRADSGLPISGQANDGYNENAWMMMISTFYADLLYIFLGFKTKYIQKEKRRHNFGRGLTVIFLSEAPCFWLDKNIWISKQDDLFEKTINKKLQ